MIDAPISRVRMRDLARPGRFRPDAGRAAAWRRACASRPGDGDLGASIIYRLSCASAVHARGVVVSQS